APAQALPHVGGGDRRLCRGRRGGGQVGHGNRGGFRSGRRRFGYGRGGAGGDQQRQGERQGAQYVFHPWKASFAARRAAKRSTRPSAARCRRAQSASGSLSMRRKGLHASSLASGTGTVGRPSARARAAS